MLCHIQVTMIAPPHIKTDRLSIERVTHVSHVPKALEGCIGQLTNQLEYRDLIAAGACINVVIQKHRPEKG